MGGLYLPGVLVRAYPRGGDGLRVCRGPEDLHGVRQVHGRIHAPALHAHAAPEEVLRGVEETRREVGRGGTGRHARVILSNKQGRAKQRLSG